MHDRIPGFVVTRTLPADVILGLLSGQYTLQGGVIRWAAGTQRAGQIVRHLVLVTPPDSWMPPFGPIPPGVGPGSIAQLRPLIEQLGDLPRMTSHVLRIATSTLLLSGLNLVVSAAGFGMLHGRLGLLDQQLTAIAAQLATIRTLLERTERATLRAALTDLDRIGQVDQVANRHRVLADARQTLAVIAQQYHEQLAQATTLEEALAAEEYFVLAALAQARCSAELGELRLATTEVEAFLCTWTERVRTLLKTFIVGTHPERLLLSDVADILPSAVLVDALNLAYDQCRSYEWLDELRTHTPTWYCVAGTGFWWSGPREAERNRERQLVIPAIHRLTSRHQALTGYLAQQRLLAACGMSPLHFQQTIAQIAPAEVIDGYVLLAPDEGQRQTFWKGRRG